MFLFEKRFFGGKKAFIWKKNTFLKKKLIKSFFFLLLKKTNLKQKIFSEKKFFLEKKTFFHKKYFWKKLKNKILKKFFLSLTPKRPMPKVRAKKVVDRPYANCNQIRKCLFLY